MKGIAFKAAKTFSAVIVDYHKKPSLAIPYLLVV